jgi:hypothetical protein
MAMAIAQAPTPALACIMGVTGKGGDGKDIIVLVAIVVGRGNKTKIVSLTLLYLCYYNIFYW